MLCADIISKDLELTKQCLKFLSLNIPCVVLLCLTFMVLSLYCLFDSVVLVQAPMVSYLLVFVFRWQDYASFVIVELFVDCAILFCFTIGEHMISKLHR